jgi:predicted DNA-binding transcriptional regulator YafY
MKHESQIRILHLLRYLYQHADENHPVTAADIVRYWETQGIKAGRKSVYQDIDLLAEFGLDIICQKSTQNRYFMGSRIFELPEVKLLVDAVESSRFITRRKSAELIGKLATLTSSHQARELDRPVYMDGTAKPDNESIYYTVDILHIAIREKEQIRFQYIEFAPTKEKTLKHGGVWYEFSPYALMWQRDYYYAVGWSERHGKLAQFRVDRMVNAEPLERPAVETPGFDAADYASKVFGMYDDKIEPVTLRCENEFMRSVIDRFGDGVQTEPDGPDHFIAQVDVAPSPPFFAWVFTFAGGIRITGPESAQEEMRQMAEWLK